MRKSGRSLGLALAGQFGRKFLHSQQMLIIESPDEFRGIIEELNLRILKPGPS